MNFSVWLWGVGIEGGGMCLGLDLSTGAEKVKRLFMYMGDKDRVSSGFVECIATLFYSRVEANEMSFMWL